MTIASQVVPAASPPGTRKAKDPLLVKMNSLRLADQIWFAMANLPCLRKEGRKGNIHDPAALLCSAGLTETGNEAETHLAGSAEPIKEASDLSRA